jgi:uncharacterized protein YbaP (TraB family)
MERENIEIQNKAIEKYGSNFNEEFFFSTIVNDKTFVEMFNKMINKYLDNQIKIIMKNRTKDKLTNQWIIKQLYLPV